MKTPQSLLIGWIESGAIAVHRIDEALSLTGLRPNRDDWHRFLDRLLLWVSVLALASSVGFFIAYNWNELGRFARFALVELLLLAALAAYWKLGSESVKAQSTLVAATILLGVLLALFGQTYQTGADPWQLFATWAALMLPWAAVGRTAILWLIWVALINLAILAYYQSFRGSLFFAFGSMDQAMWLIFALDTAAWAVWEWRSSRVSWLAARWPIRLLAIASGVTITLMVLRAIFDSIAAPALVTLVYFAWLAGIYLLYRRRTPDLFMLAGACLSLIVSTTAFFSWLLLDGPNSELTLLLLTVLVIGMAAAAAAWLRKVNAEFES